MDKLRGQHIINTLQKKWTLYLGFSLVLQVFAIALSLFFIAVQVFGFNPGSTMMFLLLLSLGALLMRVRKISYKDVSRYLDGAYPGLQESTHLLLKPHESLSLLEKMQVDKIDPLLPERVPLPKRIGKQLKLGALFLASAMLLGWAFTTLPRNAKEELATTPVRGSIPTKPEIKPPQVSSVRVNITPPRYTQRAPRNQGGLNIVAEEGSAVGWNIRTNRPVKNIHLVFSDRTIVPLKPVDKTGTEWYSNKLARQTGFYQAKVGDTLSQLYKFEVIKDQRPLVVIEKPAPTIIIAPGQARKVLLQATASDDYGLRQASISATISSGSGEAVNFKEQELSFAQFKPGGKSYNLQKLLDLTAMGMKPGDELYFYLRATDTRSQEKRSDVYIIRIEDTAQLMEFEGMASGVNIKPEFFRSQRQIIIEAEQLLRSKDTMSTAAFQAKSNDLGIDQKLLRLRYGKFLGEETDVEIGQDKDHHEEAETDAAFGDATKMMDEIAHKHDNSEDATFFDAQTKKQLKATLAEMWKSELQLRLSKPAIALPFAYKALKLLKELQQQTRVYVAKTGIKVTPLNPDKRLTGELAGIVSPVTKKTIQVPSGELMTIRKALGVLESVKNSEPLSSGSIAILADANVQLGNKAATEPAAYLPALEALRRIIQNSHKAGDVTLTGNAFQRMLQYRGKTPQGSTTSPARQMSDQYFKHLNRGNE